MPKQVSCLLTVPSNSRASRLLHWLDKLLEPHNMRCTMVADDSAIEQATPQNDNGDSPRVLSSEDIFKAGFSAAWSMGGYGDYDANEKSSWDEYAKEKGL